jgi:glutaredoxin
MTISVDEPITVYWQPGCSSCLRTKEFLTKHRVAFVSRNILVDVGAVDELARFGLRSVPYVTRGTRFANGQALAEVATLCDINLEAAKRHPPAELKRRIDQIVDAAGRFLGQLPLSALATQLPGRPRSYLQLSYHLFNVVDAFLEHERGIPLIYESYMRAPEPGTMSRDEVLRYGRDVKKALAVWWDGAGLSRDWAAAANVYYGDVDCHEFFERTTWHCGQHTRQLQWLLSDAVGIDPVGPLSIETWAGLPMPEQVWDPV